MAGTADGRKVDETARIHEARLREAYRQMENIVDHESRMVFWFSRTWIFLLALMYDGQRVARGF